MSVPDAFGRKQVFSRSQLPQRWYFLTQFCGQSISTEALQLFWIGFGLVTDTSLYRALCEVFHDIHRSCNNNHIYEDIFAHSMYGKV